MTTSYLLSLFRSVTVNNSFSFTNSCLFSQLGLLAVNSSLSLLAHIYSVNFAHWVLTLLFHYQFTLNQFITFTWC